MFTGLAVDFRVATRVLRKHPGFTLVASLLIAIGVAGTTVVFSVVNAVLLRKLPVSEPGGLVRVLTIQHNRPPVSEFAFPIYQEWQSRSKSFSQMFATSDREVGLSDGSTPQPIRAEFVTGSYFPALGIKAAAGRLLGIDDEWGQQDGLVAVLSYDFWTTHYHRDLGAIGRVIHLNGVPFLIVGVTPKNFSGLQIDSGPDIRLPVFAAKFIAAVGSAFADPRRCCLWQVAGRLHQGITLQAATAETSAAMHAAWVHVISERRALTEQDRSAIEHRRLTLEPLDYGISWLRSRFSRALLILMGGTMLILLLVSVNIASLLLARLTTRGTEIATRLALGATYPTLLRQYLIEGLLLSCIGGFGALLVTKAILPRLSSFLPPVRNLLTQAVPLSLHVALDIHIFLFALALAVFTAVLCSISPAWQAAQTDLFRSLRANTVERGISTMHGLLVGGQVALCVIVLSNTDLMLQSLGHLKAIPLGVDRDHIVTFTIDCGLLRYDAQQTTLLIRKLLVDVPAVPGVVSASIAARPLLRGGGLKTTIGLPGARLSAADHLNVDLNVVSEDYFHTMGMPVVAGRGYAPRDLRPVAPAPLVVNQSFAHQFFGKADPIGKEVGTGYDYIDKPEFRIIGVVANAKYRSVREAVHPTIFELSIGAPMTGDQFFQLEVRTHGDPKRVIPSIHAVMQRLEPRLPFLEIHTLREDAAASLWAEGILLKLGAIFSAVAELITGIGLYGLIATCVAQRYHEIGVRMALGASMWDNTREVIRRPVVFVALGIVLGTLSSLVIGYCIRRILYNVGVINTTAIIVTVLLILSIGILAALVPSIYVWRIQPSAALREQ